MTPDEAMNGEDQRAAQADARADAQRVTALGGALPMLDVDGTTAELIARRARAHVGKPPPRRRWLLPIAAAAITAVYTVWIILKALEVLG